MACTRFGAKYKQGLYTVWSQVQARLVHGLAPGISRTMQACKPLSLCAINPARLACCGVRSQVQARPEDPYGSATSIGTYIHIWYIGPLRYIGSLKYIHICIYGT